MAHYSLICRVDATEDDGTLGRLVNDEDPITKANCVPHVVNIEGHPHPYLIFVASQSGIEAGQELRYKYGDSNKCWWRAKASMHTSYINRSSRARD